jgi:hypothetical protein
MFDENKKRILDEIIAELAGLHEKDRQFVSFRSVSHDEPLVSIPIAELFASGERAERRAVLHEKLYQMARES